MSVILVKHRFYMIDRPRAAYWSAWSDGTTWSLQTRILRGYSQSHLRKIDKEDRLRLVRQLAEEAQHTGVDWMRRPGNMGSEWWPMP